MMAEGYLALMAFFLYLVLRDYMDKVTFVIFLGISIVELMIFSVFNGLDLSIKTILIYIITSEISAWLYKYIDKNFRKEIERLI